MAATTPMGSFSVYPNMGPSMGTVLPQILSAPAASRYSQKQIATGERYDASEQQLYCTMILIWEMVWMR